jgi:hypothetical protein
VSLRAFVAAVAVVSCSTADRRPHRVDAAETSLRDGAIDSGKMGCRIEPVTELPPTSTGVTSTAGDAAACGDVVGSIIVGTCVGGICHHAGPTQAAHLDLLSPCVADRLVGVVSTCNGRLLVDPAAPEQSFLLEKLEHDMPRCGESMPYDNHLPAPQLDCMRRWIFAIAGWR